MIQDYVLWLIDLYFRCTRIRLDDQKMVNEAIRVLHRHTSRWLGGSEEDFISLVVAEMAERLQPVPELPSPQNPPPPPFLVMLELSADAVRHRIVREARKRMVHLSAEELNQAAAPAMAPTTIEGEIFETLTVEEQTVLSLFLDGVPVQEVARKLNVSMRTVYRRLSDIKLRLSGRNPNLQSGQPLLTRSFVGETAMAVVGTYEITQDRRPVGSGLFKSFDEIKAFIETLPAGIYDVYQELPQDPNGVRNSKYFGEFTSHESGEVSYNPMRSPSRDE